MAKSPVLQFTRASLPLPGFQMIGRRHLTKAQPGFEKDVHPDSIEICYLASGRQTLAVGEEIFSLQGGDVFVTQPGEVHSSGGAPREKCLLYWVRLKVESGRSGFLKASEDETPILKKALLGLPRRFRGNPILQERLESVLDQFAERGPFWKSKAAQHLLSFAIETVEVAKKNPSGKRHPGIQKVLTHLEGHVSENPGLGDLADLAGLSTGRFSAQFREATGIAPMEYLLRKKIETAKKALGSGEAVTDVAIDLGFSSSQYFATVFRRFTGTSPTRYRVGA